MPVDLLKPTKIPLLKKVEGSKRIVEAFLTQPEPQVEVNIEATGRETQNVYVALGMYLTRHPELNVEVRYHEKKVYLVRVNPDDEKGDNV
jgi:hypothetical protein